MDGAAAADWLPYTLLAAGSVAAYVDMHTSFHGADQWQETNPLMRPFMKSEPVAHIYTQGLNTGVFVLSKKLKDSKKWYWWMPIAGSIAGHGIAARHNIRFNGSH